MTNHIVLNATIGDWKSKDTFMYSKLCIFSSANTQSTGMCPATFVLALTCSQGLSFHQVNIFNYGAHSVFDVASSMLGLLETWFLTKADL